MRFYNVSAAGLRVPHRSSSLARFTDLCPVPSCGAFLHFFSPEGFSRPFPSSTMNNWITATRVVAVLSGYTYPCCVPPLTVPRVGAGPVYTDNTARYPRDDTALQKNRCRFRPCRMLVMPAMLGFPWQCLSPPSATSCHHAERSRCRSKT